MTPSHRNVNQKTARQDKDSPSKSNLIFTFHADRCAVAVKETFRNSVTYFREHRVKIVLGLCALGLVWSVFDSQSQAIKALEEKISTMGKSQPVAVLSQEKVQASRTVTPEKDSQLSDRNDKTYDAQIAKALKEMPGVEKIVELDVKKIRGFKDTKGRVLYMLDNGRFVFVGDIVDVWAKKKLSTIEEVDNAFNRVDLKSFGFDLTRLNHISWGEGSKHVVAVIDPTCGWCQRLLQEVRNDKQLQKDYTFDFVIVGFLGQKGRDAAKALACSIAPSEAKVNAILGGEASLEHLLKAKQCDDKKLADTQLTVTAMGVQSVPYLVAPDGRFNRGKPRDIKAWLEGKATGAFMPLLKETVKTPGHPKIDVNPLKAVKRNDLNIMSVGEGPRLVSVFVDPHCGWCHKAIEEILADKELLKKFTFDFIATSILGPDSARLNKIIACAKPSKEVLNAFRKEAKDIEALNANPNCKEMKTVTTDKLRNAMNIHSVPVFVTDEGRVTSGKPSSIRSFLGLKPRARLDKEVVTPKVKKMNEEAKVHPEVKTK